MSLIACGTPASRTTVTSATAEAPRTRDQITAARLEDGIALADTIRETCNIELDAKETAHFAFDTAELSPRGATIVDAVGTCLTAGRLAGRRVAIVGYTDPVGPRRYNEALGFARAIAARLELERVGVPSGNIEARSGGESTVGGSDARIDRRVEIQLLP